MNVLVVGGAGYIGSHCVRQLKLAGHRPVVLDNLVFGHRQAVDADVSFYEADLGDVAAVRKILSDEEIGLVMHFAAFAFVGESVQEPLKYYLNNVSATLRLLEAMEKEGVKRFVFSSTCATYGVPGKLPLTEDHPQAPINPYGHTKLVIEEALSYMARVKPFSFAAFRYFNAAGAAGDGTIGEDHQPETHLIPLAIAAATGRGKPLTVFGTDYPTPDGTCLRDYVHVDDLSRAHIAAFPLLEEDGKALFYNLGTGRPFSVMDIISTVEKVTGMKVPYSIGERRAGDPPELFANAMLAGRDLGWDVQFKEPEPIIETAWKWHRDNPNGFAS